MKGLAAIIALPIIGIIVTVGTIFMLIIPAVFLGMHLIQIVNRAYEYDNSQLYLLILLSKTYNSELIYAQIANNLQTGKPDISFVKSELDEITNNQCYNLSTSTKILAQPNNCIPSKYVVQTKIAIPYNPNRLVDTLTLVID